MWSSSLYPEHVRTETIGSQRWLILGHPFTERNGCRDRMRLPASPSVRRQHSVRRLLGQLLSGPATLACLHHPVSLGPIAAPPTAAPQPASRAPTGVRPRDHAPARLAAD